MTQFIPRKSSPRLEKFDYKGPFGYFLTSNTHERRPILVNEWAQLSVDLLHESADDAKFGLLAYCFMPNHFHLLVEGLSEDSNLIRFMQRFKQITGFRYKQATGQNLWHRSFYDHVLREEDDPHQFADYLWGNPVRAGLFGDVISYPLSGPREFVEALGDRSEALSVRRDDAVDRIFQQSASLGEARIPSAMVRGLR